MASRAWLVVVAGALVVGAFASVAVARGPGVGAHDVRHADDAQTRGLADPALEALVAPEAPLAGIADVLGGLRFEPNVGQAPPEARFVARGSQTVLLTETGATVWAGAWVTFRLADTPVQLVPESPLRSVGHHFLGNDPANWRTDVPQFASVRYVGVAPGIDAIVTSEAGAFRVDHVVAPGADATRAGFVLERHDGARLDGGELEVQAGGATLRMRAPFAFQDLPAGRVPVASAFRLEGARAGYELGAHDPAAPLVIDPVLRQSTYLGASSSDTVTGVAVHGTGTVRDVFVSGYKSTSAAPSGFTGFTHIGTFPQATGMASYEAFVAKVQYDYTTRAATASWFAMLGGTLDDRGHAIAVDPAGNPIVTGYAYSKNFPIAGAIQSPVTGGVYDGSLHSDPAGCNWPDPFVAKLSSSGSSLLLSSFLGGGGDDKGYGVAADGTSGIVVSGDAQWNYLCNKQGFPSRNPAQPAHADVGNTALPRDAWVARLDLSVAPPVITFATLIGAAGNDVGRAVGTDAAGNVFVAGMASNGAAFPTTAGAFKTTGTGMSGFVAKYSPAGAVLYSTLLDGSAADEAFGLAVQPDGRAWVAGNTASTNFPACGTGAGAPCSATAVQSSAQGGTDAFALRLLATGAGVDYATYLGGGANDEASGIAWDAFAGQATVVGRTQSSDFPTGGALAALHTAKPASGTTYNAFLARIAPGSASPLEYATYHGGTATSGARGVAVDDRSVAYVAGTTQSPFETVSPIQSSHAGGTDDGFLSIWGKAPPEAILSATPSGEPTTLAPPATSLTAFSQSAIVLTSAGGRGDLPLASTAWELKDAFSNVLATGSGTTPAFSPLNLDPGAYTVCLELTDTETRLPLADHTDEACLALTIQNRPPTAAFSAPSPVLVGANVAFTDASSDQDGDVVSWSWDFGDGEVAEGAAPVHAYGSPGEYTVTLTVTDDQGGTASVQQTVVAAREPQASYTSSSPRFAGYPVTFADTSLDGGLAITSWLWDFGDGSTVSGAGPWPHVYLSPGTYIVSLTVANGLGTSTRSTPVTAVVAVPQARTDQYTMQQGGVLTVAAPGVLANDAHPMGAALSATLQGAPARGTVTLAADGSFTYAPQPGFSGVDIFTYTPGGGVTAQARIDVRPYRAPTADFELVQAGARITLTDASTQGDHAIIEWAWDFGDGVTSLSKDPAHTFADNGTYTVRLRVTDVFGLTGTAVATVEVERGAGPQPDPTATPTVTVPQGGSTWRPGGVQPIRIVSIPEAATYGDANEHVVVGAPPAPGNLPPVPAVVHPYTAAVGDRVTLDAGSSYDPESDAFVARFRQVSGPPVLLDVDGLRATFHAAAGEYVFEVELDDGKGTSRQQVTLGVAAVADEEPRPAERVPTLAAADGSAPFWPWAMGGAGVALALVGAAWWALRRRGRDAAESGPEQPQA